MSENRDTLEKGIMVGENLTKEYSKYSTKGHEFFLGTQWRKKYNSS